MITIKCLFCKKEFKDYQCYKRIYCSVSCATKVRHINQEFGFKVGNHPESEFKKNDPRISGENAYQWKGDNVGYVALHDWVKNKLGSAWKCLKCDGSRSTKFEWANVSGEYKRDLTDWTMLCSKCHKEYDKGNIPAKRHFIKTDETHFGRRIVQL